MEKIEKTFNMKSNDFRNNLSTIVRVSGLPLAHIAALLHVMATELDDMVSTETDKEYYEYQLKMSQEEAERSKQLTIKEDTPPEVVPEITDDTDKGPEPYNRPVPKPKKK